MVRNYVRKTTRGSWSIIKMKEAIDAVLSKKMGTGKASKLYGIPESTLKSRVRRIRKYGISFPNQDTSIKEEPGSEEEHEETVEASISNPPPPERMKNQSVAIQNQEQDQTSNSFTSHSVNEPLEETCSLITKSLNAHTLNPTALYWTQKLVNLEPTQRLFAEKFINDVLFEAELGNLGRYSVVINGGDQILKSTPSGSDCIPTTSSNN